MFENLTTKNLESLIEHTFIFSYRKSDRFFLSSHWPSGSMRRFPSAWDWLSERMIFASLWVETIQVYVKASLKLQWKYYIDKYSLYRDRFVPVFMTVLYWLKLLYVLYVYCIYIYISIYIHIMYIYVQGRIKDDLKIKKAFVPPCIRCSIFTMYIVHCTYIYI